MTKLSNYILDVLTLSIFSCFDFEHEKLDSSEDGIKHPTLGCSDSSKEFSKESRNLSRALVSKAPVWLIKSAIGR